MKNNKSPVIQTIQSLIIDKLKKKEIVTSADVNQKVLYFKNLMKKSHKIYFRISKQDARKIFKHVQSRLVLNGSGV